MDRRVLAVLLNQFVGGAVDVDGGGHILATQQKLSGFRLQTTGDFIVSFKIQKNTEVPF